MRSDFQKQKNYTESFGLLSLSYISDDSNSLCTKHSYDASIFDEKNELVSRQHYSAVDGSGHFSDYFAFETLAPFHTSLLQHLQSFQLSFASVENSSSLKLLNSRSITRLPISQIPEVSQGLRTVFNVLCLLRDWARSEETQFGRYLENEMRKLEKLSMLSDSEHVRLPHFFRKLVEYSFETVNSSEIAEVLCSSNLLSIATASDLSYDDVSRLRRNVGVQKRSSKRL